MYREIVSLVATFIEAYTTLWEANQLIFTFFKLQGIHIEFGINRTSIEQELMSWNGEQRLCHLTNAFNIKVLQILTT
ncbi:hypothetical protein SDC9_203071 [bioreactor metagenome]|uniref:Uncharacterized protein n=1 Tax=bioreactor metagenome TaxID=1076179 RepID=A0A645IY70_9ZZZZ